MNPTTALSIVGSAVSIIEGLIADARARNDEAAVASLVALVADSTIGAEIVAGMVRAQAAIDAGRAQLVEALETRDTPALGVPALDSLAAMAARENG